jgi:hypothetical protein
VAGAGLRAPKVWMSVLTTIRNRGARQGTMDDAVEASAERVRDHLRRPLAGNRNLLMRTAGNTVSETVPCEGPRRLSRPVAAVLRVSPVSGPCGDVTGTPVASGELISTTIADGYDHRPCPAHSTLAGTIDEGRDCGIASLHRDETECA